MKNEIYDPNNPGMFSGKEVFGYKVKRVEELPEIESVLYELEHMNTGARHIHISNEDTENAAGITLKTIPADSTGVAHILEHTVLCGSKNFPVRDPFFHMMRRSLSTFMNALTSSDWTMYPFSTQNEKDFYNLFDVYLDAVFYPLLDPLNFKQEGHRLELEKKNGKEELVYKGVVYNEMRGAMSSPNQVMFRTLMKALFPSTTYGFNSGGDPEFIPTLTYEQLCLFHERHYHPSNSWIFTYGNLPVERHLDFIENKILRHFEKIDPRTEVPSHPRWDESKIARYTYPLDPAEDPEKKCQICVAWVMAEIRDSFEVLVMTLLSQILLGNPASPLRRALIESGLGSSLCDATGYEYDLKDTFFACGLKDTAESDAEQIEKIIFGVLNDLAANGIDPEMVESAIHQLEFHRKERTNQPYPYGIKMQLLISGSWIHGGDPVRLYRFDKDVERLREEIEKGPFLENKIRQYFLENKHRVLFKLIPDQEQEERENRRIREELDRIQSALSPMEVESIKEQAKELKKRQETEEDVSCLPTLQIEDIPTEVESVEETFHDRTGPDAIYSQPTSGIFYFTAAIGAGRLPARVIPLVPFFCYAFTRSGSKLRDYSDMARLIDAHTGGMGIGANSRVQYDDKGTCLPFLSFNGKCLDRKAPNMFEIIRELMANFDFSDGDRLRKLLSQFRASLESKVVNQGHMLSMTAAARNFSVNRQLAEMWNGITLLKYIKSLAKDLDDAKMENLIQDLDTIARACMNESNAKIIVIGEDQTIQDAFGPVSDIKNSLLKEGEAGFCPPDLEPGSQVLREGWSTSSAVSFVARAKKTARYKDPDAPVLAVISKLLRSLYLHTEIREKGGAYGGFSRFDAENGVFYYASYRDPHIVNTLEVYKGVDEFLHSAKYGEKDVRESILQVCADIDTPDTPGTKARKAFYRKLVGLTDEDRKVFKSRILSTDINAIKDVAEKYFTREEAEDSICVISSEEKLKSANERMEDKKLEIHRI